MRGPTQFEMDSVVFIARFLALTTLVIGVIGFTYSAMSDLIPLLIMFGPLIGISIATLILIEVHK